MKRKKRTELHRQISEMQSAIKLYCYECNGAKKIDCDLPDCNLYDLRPFGTKNKRLHNKDSPNN